MKEVSFEVANIKDLGRNTPICGILQRVMENVKGPISCEELTVHALESWGRGFPSSPYNDVCMVYRLASTYLDVEAIYDDIKDLSLSSEGDGRQFHIDPDMPPSELNRMVDAINRIKFVSAKIR